MNMTSINTPQPVSYGNGVTNLAAKERNAYNRPHVQLITGEEGYDLSDSDIDGLSTNRSLLLTNGPVPIQKSETNENKDDSLMHWLMQQFQQNGIEQDRRCSDISSNQDRISQSNFMTNGKPTDQASDTLRHSKNEVPGRDRWTKSCTKLDKVKPCIELHYPRMQQSSDKSLQRKLINPVESVNKLLDEINQKAEGLKNGNDRITKELEKANHIIGDLKQTHSVKRYPPERWATSTTALPQSRYDSGRKIETPVVRLRRLNNTKMSSAQSLLTRSAYPDPICDDTGQSGIQLNESKGPTVHHLPSDQRFVMDDSLPQPSSSFSIDAFGAKEEIRLRRTKPVSMYPVTRRYSSAQQAETIRVREEYRESSLGPLNSGDHRGSNSSGVSGINGITSKLSWLGRAISQLSLVDWTGRSRGEAKPEVKRVENGTPEIYGCLSPQMNSTKHISTMVRRPFRRKATTPNPESDLEQSNSTNRCLSLMQLNGSQSTTFEEGDQRPVHAPVYSQTDQRINGSFVRKFSHDRSMEKLNRQDGLIFKECSPIRTKPNGLPRIRRKRDMDADSCVCSVDTGWKY